MNTLIMARGESGPDQMFDVCCAIETVGCAEEYGRQDKGICSQLLLSYCLHICFTGDEKSSTETVRLLDLARSATDLRPSLPLPPSPTMSESGHRLPTTIRSQPAELR